MTCAYSNKPVVYNLMFIFHIVVSPIILQTLHGDEDFNKEPSDKIRADTVRVKVGHGRLIGSGHEAGSFQV